MDFVTVQRVNDFFFFTFLPLLDEITVENVWLK